MMVSAEMLRKPRRIADIYINISHFLDHFMMLIFAKAAYDAGVAFGLGYDEIIIYGTLGFVLFGGFAPVAAQLADQFSRASLMIIYHFGIGLAAIAAGFAQTAWQLGLAIGIMGMFAAIYHPVGIAMLLKSGERVGFRLGINGVFGNMGVALAPLVTGLLLISGSWQLCFLLPGLFCLGYGIAFTLALKDDTAKTDTVKKHGTEDFAPNWVRALAALTVSTASGGMIFGTMTFIVPRYFEVTMTGLTTSVAITGLLAAIVYAVASFAQIGVGLLVDRFSARRVLFVMGVGQAVFIWLAAQYQGLVLFFAMLAAMSFVFGQIPIGDTVLSRFIPDRWRGKVLSIKFLLNLGIGASVLPVSSFILQAGYSMSWLFSCLSIVAVFVSVAALMLPPESSAERVQPA